MPPENHPSTLNEVTIRREEELIQNIKDASLQLVSFIFIAIGFVLSSSERILFSEAFVQYISYAMIFFMLSFAFALYMASGGVRSVTETRPLLGKLSSMFLLNVFLFNTGLLFMVCAVLILLGPLRAPIAFSQNFMAAYGSQLAVALLPISLGASLLVTFALANIYSSLEE